LETTGVAATFGAGGGVVLLGLIDTCPNFAANALIAELAAFLIKTSQF